MPDSIMYHEGNRRLQDEFDSRKISDRLEEKLTRTRFSDEDIAFVENSIFFLYRYRRHGGTAGLLVQGRQPGLRARERTR